MVQGEKYVLFSYSDQVSIVSSPPQSIHYGDAIFRKGTVKVDKMLMS
jgi:hypothetical protein